MSADLDQLGWSPPGPPKDAALGRPADLSDVFGQDEAVAAIRRFLESVLDPDRQPLTQKTLLLSGTAGVGKTTLVRIIANALLCARTGDDLQPCGRCPVCKAFRTTPPVRIDDFLEFSAAEHGGVDALGFIVDAMRRAPLGRFRVGFADEAHRASRVGKDALLKALEEPPRWAVYLLATTEPDKLGAALLSRCTHIRLCAPQVADRLALLRRRCEAWGLAPGAVEPAALELIEAHAGPSFRELVAELDRRIKAGPLTLAAVRRAYPDPLAPCLVCLECLLDGDRAGAVAALSQTSGTPNEKRARMQELLASLSLCDVRHVVVGRHPLNDLPIERRRAVVARVEAQPARASSPSLAALLEDCARLWGGAVTTQTELLLLLMRFADALDTPSPASAPAAPNHDLAVPRPRPGAGRRRTGGVLGEDRRCAADEDRRRSYLDAAQVAGLYEAVSFLGQAFGLLLNVSVELDHGVGSGASAATTDFARRALRILQRRGQPEFHFVYAQEIDPHGHRRTRLAAHIPPGRCLDSFTTWAQEDFTTTGRRAAPKVSVRACRAAARAERIGFHAHAFKSLLRGVDPNILDLDETGRRPLADLLALPASERGPIGRVDPCERFNTSQSLAPAARERAAADGMEFLSALRDRAWPWLYRGWEVEEHRARLDERAARDAARARIDALWPPGPNALLCARRASELALLDTRCGLPAELRPRSAHDWWGAPSSVPFHPRSSVTDPVALNSVRGKILR